MRRGQVLGAVGTVLLCGAAAALPAQRGQSSGRREQNRSQHAPAARGGEARGGPGSAQRTPRQLQRTPAERNRQQAEQRQTWQHHRLPESQMPRNWGELGGYHGARIPTAYFSSHFGYGHKFRVYSLPFLVVSNAPRFQFNGYWFELAGPVPAYWGPDWYRNDDVFIVFAYGGYYLDNARFPGRPGVAVSVIF